jgi:hypothetical protein
MARSLDVPDATSDYVERLHSTVDNLVAPLRQRHGERLQCRRGCHACCTDGLEVFEIEAALIERHYSALLDDGRPHPPGACAFLGAEGECRVYTHRPYVCRTQGLPLRWAEDNPDASGGIVEARDICPLNETGGLPLIELDDDDCWTLGPVERRLAIAQAGVDDSEGRRVVLRTLFRHQ